MSSRTILPLLLCTCAAACAVETTDPATDHVARAATFDWGGDCSFGSGSFSQYIARSATTAIGDIPAGKRNVRIDLRAAADVDVQLIERSTGHQIIAWPSGDLNGPTEACTTYKNVQYCYSGYNGDGTGLGNEWIEVRGDTNTELRMRAYGYEAGTADVEYAWQAVPTCNEKGSGTFEQYIPRDAITTVGAIPVNKVNVRIELRSAQDVDVQLYAGDTAIVKWPDGILNGPTAGSTLFEDMHIEYSGYNGDGTGLGHEYIEIHGRVTRELTMKAFGYAAGTATVAYAWGGGAGAACGTRGLAPCGPGLQCKDGATGDIARDIPGTCHTQSWCETEESAAADCAGLIHIAIPGAWGCDEFQCVWRTGPTLTCSMADTTCPDGYTCEWGCPSAEPCGINPPGVCLKECASSADCSAAQYCSTDGLCRTDSTCAADADCNAAGNEWDFGYCIATMSARNVCTAESTCDTICVPIGTP